MEMNIFAVKDDIVQSFYVSMDENLVRMFRVKIDEWSGKGELKQIKAVNLMNYVESGKKIEVVSKRYSGKGKAVYYCSSSIEIMPMYNYKFYQFTPHPLSKLCDNLLKDCESLDFSKHLAELLNWSSDDDEEMEFVGKLISAFKFKKTTVEEIVQSDLTIDEKRNVLRRIVDAIKNVSQPRKIVASPRSYEEEVERKINNMEVFNSDFYERKLHGEDFKYTPEQKVIVKRKILTSLPTSDSIMKANK